MGLVTPADPLSCLQGGTNLHIVAVINKPQVQFLSISTFFNQLTVPRILSILHIMTKHHNYVTIAYASNLVAEYLNAGKKAELMKKRS